MPNSSSAPPARTIHLGTSGALDDELVRGLAARGVVALPIAADADPPAEIDVVLVLQPPSALIGRCRGRWPVIVGVDDPRATDVSRLLRAGVSDVIRSPIQASDLVDRIHRLLLPPTGESTDDDT